MLIRLVALVLAFSAITGAVSGVSKLLSNGSCALHIREPVSQDTGPVQKSGFHGGDIVYMVTGGMSDERKLGIWVLLAMIAALRMQD